MTTILLTGASRGIGAALRERKRADGFKVTRQVRRVVRGLPCRVVAEFHAVATMEREAGIRHDT